MTPCGSLVLLFLLASMAIGSTWAASLRSSDFNQQEDLAFAGMVIITDGRIYIIGDLYPMGIWWYMWNGLWDVLPTGSTPSSPSAVYLGDRLIIAARGMDDGIYLWEGQWKGIYLSPSILPPPPPSVTNWEGKWIRLPGATKTPPTVT